MNSMIEIWMLKAILIVSGMRKMLLGNGILCHKVAKNLPEFCSHSSVSWEVGPVSDRLGV